MEQNLTFYNNLRKVPKTATKKINGGRLNNMTDINPMWRIKALTEQFGPCGIGWKYEITRQWTESYGVEVKSFTNINLFIKVGETWSDAIPGTGGSTLVEAKGYVNDEAYKMSLTDALSVAMKALGVGADIYFGADANTDYGTKYEKLPESETPPAKTKAAPAKPDNDDVDWFREFALPAIKQANDKKSLRRVYDSYPNLQGKKEFMDALSAKKAELGIQ